MTMFGAPLTRNVNKLSRAAQKLAAGNVEVDADLPAIGRDEVGRLAASFVEMAGSQRLAALAAEAVASGDLRRQQLARSDQDRLGHALEKMIDDLRVLVSAVTDGSEQIKRNAEDLSFAAQSLGVTSEQIVQTIGQGAIGADAQRSSAADVLSELTTFGAHVNGLSIATRTQESDAGQLDDAVTVLRADLDRAALSVRNVADAAQRSADTARDGSDAIAASIASTEQVGGGVLQGAQRLEALRAQSERVGEIVIAIDTIAD
jgi:methyl-accepting chemotaxis protein